MKNAKKIFDKIKATKIEPKSKWKFLIKNYTFWTLFILAIIIGAMAFSVLIFLLFNNDWDVYKYLDKGLLSYIFLSLPYLWIIVLVLFSFLAYLNYTHTKKGYKINPIILISTSILFSILLGSIFFKGGFGEIIDHSFSKNIPYYEKMIGCKQMIWNNPEKGLLAGKIIKITNNNFYIEDLNKKSWLIVGNNIIWKKRVIKKEGVKVKIIGRKTNEDYVFIAKEIRPWARRGYGVRNK